MADESQPSSRRERSRRLLLEELRRKGVATRAELGRATGLSRSAVAAGVGDLIAAGLISEDGSAAGQLGGRGRRSALLRATQPAGHVLGIDFGHMHVRVALADTGGRVVAERMQSIDVDARAVPALDLAARVVGELLGESGVARQDVLAVGSGIPGPLDRHRRVVSSPTILHSWIGFAPAEELSRRLGLPVHIENDADMGAIGEKRFGAACEYTDFVYIKASHGIGASVVLDGRVYRGSLGIAGEIGHTHMPGTFNRCRCGKQGCLEAVISVPEVRRQLTSTHLRENTDGHEPPLSVVASDPVGARVLTDAGRIVGRVVADGCNWLNPQAVILGGELGVSGPAFADGVKESLDRYAQPATADAVAVRTAGLGQRSEVMGAIAVAIDHCTATTG